VPSKSTEPSRVYRSPTRERQADETRRRIADAAEVLFRAEGYEPTTIDAIARRADVASQTVYATFGSKRGILTELIDRAAFGTEYQELVSRALESRDPVARLRFAAAIARRIFDAQSAMLDFLYGASVVSPELAEIVRGREGQRYERQAGVVDAIVEAGRLKQGLTAEDARAILWSLTCRELYRLLVQERGWRPAQYERWLGEQLELALLAPRRRRKSEMRPAPPRRTRARATGSVR
jgi:AcrR family transcriptional regulator